jgi:hypothetical protein
VASVDRLGANTSEFLDAADMVALAVRWMKKFLTSS